MTCRKFQILIIKRKQEKIMSEIILNGGVGFLMEYRKNPDKYLPMVDHNKRIYASRTEEGDRNLGWNCGLLECSRPFFIEAWVTDGLTMLTVYIATDGIEHYSNEEVDAFLQKQGVYQMIEGAAAPQVAKYKDGSGNEFFTVNIIVGLPDKEDTFITGDNPIIYSIDDINALNN